MAKTNKNKTPWLIIKQGEDTISENGDVYTKFFKDNPRHEFLLCGTHLIGSFSFGWRMKVIIHEN